MSKTERKSCVLVISAILCGVAVAQPSGIYLYKVVNAANYSEYIAPGSIFVLFGSGLGPQSLVQASQPLPLSLQGTSIQVQVAGVTVSCPMLYASDGQTAGVLPSNTPTGEGELVLSVSGHSSWPSPVKIVSSAFGIFTPSGTGIGAGSITSADYKLNTVSAPAASGDTILVWGTGLGAVAGDDGTVPKPGTSLDGVEVFMGNQTVRVAYAGRSGCCAGLDQIAVEVPKALAGCFIPVAVRRAGQTSNFVWASISQAGEPCTSKVGLPVDLPARLLAKEQIRTGAIALGPIGILDGAGFNYSAFVAARLSAALKTRVSERDVQRLIRARLTGDRRALRTLVARYAGAIRSSKISGRAAFQSAAAAFGEMGVAAGFGVLTNAQQLGTAAPAALPEPGTCTILSKQVANGLGARSRQLDAGPSLTYQGPEGIQTFRANRDGMYLLSLGSVLPDTGLRAGYYQISGTGGRDVPAFQASLTVPAPLVWTNKSALGIIDRAQPLTITWSGGPGAGYVIFGVTSGDWDHDNESLLVCAEDVKKGALSVPAFTLAGLPATQRGYAFVAPHPLNQRLSIDGLDLVYVANASSDYRTNVIVR